MKNSVIVLLSNYYSDNQINKNDTVEASTYYAKEREAIDNNKNLSETMNERHRLGDQNIYRRIILKCMY
jgi:hypothetical protein